MPPPSRWRSLGRQRAAAGAIWRVDLVDRRDASHGAHWKVGVSSLLLACKALSGCRRTSARQALCAQRRSERKRGSVDLVDRARRVYHERVCHL
jgi:hypothetical protein